MKIDLVKQIEELIEGHKQAVEDLNTSIKAVHEEFESPTAKAAYKDEFIKESIKKGIEKAKADNKAIDTLLNQKLQLIIGDTKKSLISDKFKQAKVDGSVEYSAKITNALGYINAFGSDIDDEAANLVLKDFADDYDQMKLFKNLISKKVDIVDSEGNSTFPKTFGKLNEIESLLNRFDDIEAISNVTLLHPKEDSFSIIFDSYEESCDEERLVLLTGKLEDKINGVSSADEPIEN